MSLSVEAKNESKTKLLCATWTIWFENYHEERKNERIRWCEMLMKKIKSGGLHKQWYAKWKKTHFII